MFFSVATKISLAGLAGVMGAALVFLVPRVGVDEAEVGDGLRRDCGWSRVLEEDRVPVPGRIGLHVREQPLWVLDPSVEPLFCLPHDVSRNSRLKMEVD